jgi:endoglucanase Acf2
MATATVIAETKEAKKSSIAPGSPSTTNGLLLNNSGVSVANVAASSLSPSSSSVPVDDLLAAAPPSLAELSNSSSSSSSPPSLVAGHGGPTNPLVTNSVLARSLGDRMILIIISFQSSSI